MIKLSLLTAGIFTAASVFAQKHRIELDLTGRYDRHANNTTRFGNRSYTNDTKLWGKSSGINFNYILSISRHLRVKIGAGYYKLGIDKIRQSTPFNRVIKGRNINYTHPSGAYILLGTRKYHYDNLDLVIGLAYEQPVNKKFDMQWGANFVYLYTFSQLYHIPYDDGIRHHTDNNYNLGYSFNLDFGVRRKFSSGKYYVSPKIILPVYQQLKGDDAFGEPGDLKVRKYFNGIGISIALGVSL